MTHFEVVSRFKNADIHLPTRKTQYSAGYDFEVVEDTLIPSYVTAMNTLYNSYGKNTVTLDEIAGITKLTGIKPTLVPTGIKAKLDPSYYLQLSVRSSCPLKNWLILANGVGIIDADYYNNDDNEGEIFFQLINLSPFEIQLKKGDRIGQGIILPYHKVSNDTADSVRTGGFGSTEEEIRQAAIEEVAERLKVKDGIKVYWSEYDKK